MNTLNIFSKRPLARIMQGAVLMCLIIVGSCTSLYLKYIDPIEIPGFDSVIVSDTTWERTDTPYRIEKNLFVLPTATLTIAPGVTLELSPGVLLKCQGRIVARGTPAQPIHIRGTGGDPWERIECFGGRFERDGRLPVNIFHHLIVQDGGGITVRAAAAEIIGCEFKHNSSSPIRLEFASGRILRNEIHRNSTAREPASGNGAGIMVYTDKPVLVAENNVHDNISDGGRDGGGGIYAFAYERGDVSVARNTVYNNTSDRHGGGMVVYSCKVEGNTVYNNHAADSGGGIYAIGSRLVGNTVHQNTAHRGGGIYAEKLDLSSNCVYANTGAPRMGSGLFYYGNGRISNNTFVNNVAEGGPGDTLVVSGGPVIHGNNIIAETGHALRLQTHSLNLDLDAGKNFWGTVDAATIDRLVFDWLDDSSIGLVNWRGYVRAPLPEAPSIPVSWSMPPSPASPSPTVLKGVLAADCTLGRPEGTTYRVTGNLLIPEGVTVDVLPGTRFEIDPQITIRVRGALNAVGTSKMPALMTGDPEKPWGKLLFERRSTMAAGENGEDGADSEGAGRLGHVVVEYGEGILLDGTGPEIADCIIRDNKGSGITLKDAGVAISRCRIINNQSPTNGGGICTYGSKLVHIRDNEIAGNLANGDGGGVFAYGERSDTAANLVKNRISGNRCKGSGGGVWASRTSLVGNDLTDNDAAGKGGGVFSKYALVEENIIARNRAGEGGGVFAEANSSLTRNRIFRNSSSAGPGGGVYLNFWGMSIKNEIFAYNQVTENEASGENPVGGVYLNGYMVFEYNNIFQNAGFELHNANPSREDPLEAKGCYWGAGSLDDIETAVYHGKDDSGLALVHYESFARQPNPIGKAEK